MTEYKHPTLAAALAAFQVHLPRVAKDNTARVVTKEKGSYTYDYADLTDITDVALPLLAEQGLAWTTMPTMFEGAFVLIYTLRHESGETIEGIYPLPGGSTPAQQLGGAITYARRYALCAVTGIAPGGDDDDAGTEPAAGPMPAPMNWAELLEKAKTEAAVRSIGNGAMRAGQLTADLRTAVAGRIAEFAISAEVSPNGDVPAAE
ncbi:ERF family protein [Mycetocola spongiae]|uniref:ERF family protein n=1 Tax=Mycetocola spongiae TaxID=2859226 RepID=UPI001CF369B0|nr:ERF family protein [Mycetocola spongiae]UCR89276.1 ERF family protein [Mycetocola spongiae]